MNKVGLLCAIFICLQQHVYSDIGRGVLEKYPSNIFVVTGIGRGVTIENALFAKKSEIYVMDEDNVIVEHIKKILHHIVAFAQHTPKEIKFFHDIPKTALYTIIKEIRQPAIFLLSSYVCDPDNMDKASGILDELEQFKKHSIKNHTILIDYLSPANACFGNLRIEDVKAKLLEINPMYSFRLEQGGYFGYEDNGVLVAYIA